MQIDWWTLGLQAVNFLVLVWLLQRFLYRPVMAVIARRRAEADKSLDEAARREKLADEARQALDAERKSEMAARDATRRELKAEMEAERRKTAEEARKEAGEILEAARAKVEDERAEALKSLRVETIDLGIDVAGRLLSKTVSKSLDDVFLDRICDHLATLAPERLAALHGVGGKGARVTVVTASALDAGGQARWRERLLKVLGADAAIDFRVDAALIAGADLHFKGAILRFSWGEGLEQARRELRSRAEAE